jgi:hypothetical protein
MGLPHWVLSQYSQSKCDGKREALHQIPSSKSRIKLPMDQFSIHLVPVKTIMIVMRVLVCYEKKTFVDAGFEGKSMSYLYNCMTLHQAFHDLYH